jgi:hypothetical protein
MWWQEAEGARFWLAVLTLPPESPRRPVNLVGCAVRYRGVYSPLSMATMPPVSLAGVGSPQLVSLSPESPVSTFCTPSRRPASPDATGRRRCGRHRAATSSAGAPASADGGRRTRHLRWARWAQPGRSVDGALDRTAAVAVATSHAVSGPPALAVPTIRHGGPSPKAGASRARRCTGR